MVVGLGTYSLIQFNVLPVALVNRSFISAREFNESVQTVEHYYGELAKQSGAEQGELNLIEVKRATLDKLIENALIEDELEARMTQDELSQRVTEKINALSEIKAPDFGSAVFALYGLSTDRFMALVLEPKAREEVFTELNNAESFAEGVKTLREQAIVRILVPGLHWENAGVIVRGR